MTSKSIRMLVAFGFAIGLLLGAAVYVPRIDSRRSVVSQETPRFPSEPTGQGAAPDGP